MGEGKVLGSPLDGKLEPEAKPINTSPSDAALVSIAISLKRIADAVTGTEQSQGMHGILWEMANRSHFS